MNFTKGLKPDGSLGQPKKVLVMDDTPLIRENLSNIMKHLGYDVIETSEGGEAIDNVKNLMQHCTISLAILDLHVPSGIGGATTAIQLREMDPFMKIIISTGSSESEFSQTLNGIQIDGILLKPYSIEKLKEVLESLEHETGLVSNSGAGKVND